MGIFKKKNDAEIFRERIIPSFITKNKDNGPVDFDALAEEMRQTPRLTDYARKTVEIETVSRLEAIATLIRDCTFEELVTLGREVYDLGPIATNSLVPLDISVILNKWARSPIEGQKDLFEQQPFEPDAGE